MTTKTNTYKRVHYITAGAGAGKTTTLVNIISHLITKAGADPGRMMLTTYTDAAASEFRERSKEALLEEGLAEEAIALDRSAMGTIHSIASRYIGRYWYLLGMAPDVRPLDKDTSKVLMNRSLERLVKGEDVALFKRYVETFGITQGLDGYHYDFWKETLRDLFDKIRGYDFGEDQVASFRDYSLDILRRTFHQGGNRSLLARESAALNAYLSLDPLIAAYGTGPSQKQFATNRDQIRRILSLNPEDICASEAAEIGAMKWGSAPTLVKTCPDKAEAEAKAAACHGALKESAKTLAGLLVPKEHSLISEVTERIFALMKDWMEAYERIKKENGVIDYADMEEKFLQLLEREEVRQDISRSVNYLFVDEFQDCSPIQTRIFEILSGLVRQSWFVGDRKQAIYGFAGSDSGLVYELTKLFPAPQQSVDHVSDLVRDGDGNSASVLPLSYRSLPALVDAANAVFSSSFGELHNKDFVPKEEVELRPTRDNPPSGQDVLYHVTVTGDNSTARSDALATFICKMSTDPQFTEKYKLSDVAVLTRWNAQAQAVAGALARKNIPTGYVDTDFKDTPEVALILCLLKLSEGISTAKTRAEIRKLLLGEDLDTLVRRIAGGKNTLDDIEGLEDYARSLRTASVTDRINAFITRFGLLDECAAWGMKDARRRRIRLLVQAAEQFSASAALLCSGADVRGFLSFLRGYKPDVKFDNTADGVKVLTFHKSKGLDWKIVILYGIDEYKEPNSIDGITIRGETRRPTNLFVSPALPDKPWALGCIQADPEANDILMQCRSMHLGEEKRLLYVGFTRAKDALVTVAQSTAPGTVRACCPTARKANAAPAGGKVDLWGVPAHPCTYIEVEDDDSLTFPLAASPEIYRDAGLSLKAKAAPAKQKYVSPSLHKDPSETEKARVSCEKDFGHRTGIPHASLEDNVFGDLVHHVFAACVPGGGDANRRAAERTLTAYGVTDAEGAGKLAVCIEELYGWLKETYGDATDIERELPFRYCENGQVFSGNMDLVWHTAKGCVLVDYKTFQGSKADLFDSKSPHWAGGYASQLGVYARALKARDGKEPLACVLYYPMEGLVLSL